VSVPVHVAITRRVRPGCEAEFERELMEFIRASFAQHGVLGASMLAPLPGSGSREYGVLRTFASEAECAAFRESPVFKAWDERAAELTEGAPEYRRLHGLEAWFRAPQGPPPRWKMALLIFAAVYSVTSLLIPVIGATIRSLPFLLGNAIFNLIVVGLLTWLVMPVLTRAFARWLSPSNGLRGRRGQ